MRSIGYVILSGTEAAIRYGVEASAGLRYLVELRSNAKAIAKHWHRHCEGGKPSEAGRPEAWQSRA